MQVKIHRNIREPGLLDTDVAPHMLHFPGNTDRRRIVQLPQIAPEVFGKVVHQLRGGVRLNLTQLLDAAKGIVNKMGLDLAHHDCHAAFRQLVFLFGDLPLSLCQLFFLFRRPEQQIRASDAEVNQQGQQGQPQTGGGSPNVVRGSIRRHARH